MSSHWAHHPETMKRGKRVPARTMIRSHNLSILSPVPWPLGHAYCLLCVIFSFSLLQLHHSYVLFDWNASWLKFTNLFLRFWTGHFWVWVIITDTSWTLAGSSGIKHWSRNVNECSSRSFQWLDVSHASFIWFVILCIYFWTVLLLTFTMWVCFVIISVWPFGIHVENLNVVIFSDTIRYLQNKKYPFQIL